MEYENHPYDKIIASNGQESCKRCGKPREAHEMPNPNIFQPEGMPTTYRGIANFKVGGHPQQVITNYKNDAINWGQLFVQNHPGTYVLVYEVREELIDIIR